MAALDRSIVLLLALAAGAMGAAAGSCSGQEPKYVPPPCGAPADAVKLADDAFVAAKDGKPVQMTGVSWFGAADNASATVDALWSSGSAHALDLPALAYQLRAQGFNSIRLPFNFADLRATPKNMWAKQGCRKVTLGTSPPAAAEGGAAAATAEPPAGDAAGRCRWYLPDTSSLDRFLWTAQWFVANGFYVLAELRPVPGDAATAASTEAFADAWRWLWRRAACLPNFQSDLAGRVFVKLMAAPDASGYRWEAATLHDGVDRPGITELYLGAMDALWAETPGEVVFFIAGAGQGGASNWGSGFVTDKATIAVNDYSDPNPFFQALLKRPYRRAVVISPSVYNNLAPVPHIDPSDPGAPPAAPAWPEGAGPIKVMDTTFSYLAKSGYCAGTPPDCQRFPVAVGDFSSRLAGSSELHALNEFAGHLRKADVKYEGVGTWRFWGFEDAGAAGPARS